MLSPLDPQQKALQDHAEMKALMVRLGSGSDCTGMKAVAALVAVVAVHDVLVAAGV